MKIIPVIIAGGAGTRLWPVSTPESPKQFHSFGTTASLYNGTVARLLPLKPDAIVTVTSEKYRAITTEESQTFSLPMTVIGEPEARNTAAAILYAAKFLQKEYDDAVMIVLPADHYIGDEETFRHMLTTGIEEARKGSLVTLGITPDHPETGYGYIRTEENSGTVRPVDRFVEKPDRATAEEYLRDGRYFWNSGIFIWSVSTIIEEFSSYMPAHLAAFEEVSTLSSEEMIYGSNSAIQKIFASLEPVSIDYGILEKTDRAVVIPGDFQWADLGNWPAIDDLIATDSEGNRASTGSDALFVESENCTVHGEKSTIALAGMKDVIVVEKEGKILIMHKNASQSIREVVTKFRESR